MVIPQFAMIIPSGWRKAYWKIGITWPHTARFPQMSYEPKRIAIYLCIIAYMIIMAGNKPSEIQWGKYRIESDLI
jgi:hypothetical protein